MANIEFNIDRVAKLAVLDLSDEEKSRFQEQLPSIVAYISKMQEVDVSNIEAKAYLTKEFNIFRDDIVDACDSEMHERLIKAFPKSKGDVLEVPGVFE